MKTIVTHHLPDLDGIPGIWLLKRFHPSYKDAKVAFVPAGETLNGMPPDSNPDILHVDTGGGKFDHHQTNAYTCGAKLILDYLMEEGYVAKDDKALIRMIDVLVALDHGKDNEWPDSESDVYDFGLWGILNGWKMMHSEDEQHLVELVMPCLDAVYRIFKSKVECEAIFETGTQFTTRWGKGIGFATHNDGVLEMGIRRGYALVIRKDPKREFIRVTGDSRKGVDLTKVYDMCKEQDPIATWFLHASKVLLRNGSTRNPKMQPTKLSLEEMIKILEQS